MRIFVAGAGGAIGKRLVPLLAAEGHHVIAMTRSHAKAESLKLASSGIETVVADGLDRTAVVEAVRRTRPDVVIHQMTALTEVENLKNFDAEFSLTNRLRTEGTDYLLEGAIAAGARQFIAQSYGGWTYERSGTALKTEDDPFDPNPPTNQRKSLEAIQYLERKITQAQGIKGVALRYANFYGPGTGLAKDGVLVKAIHARKLPIIGNGAGVWSFIHVDDAATATKAVMDSNASGIYNIVDDEPAPVAVWLPELARILNAKPPLRVPTLIGKLAAGEVGVSMMTRIRGISNAKAKRELRWQLRYPTWRIGFRSGL